VGHTGTSTGRLMLASNAEDLGALYGSIKRKLEREA
jgi:hypothetical protein